MARPAARPGGVRPLSMGWILLLAASLALLSTRADAGAPQGGVATLAVAGFAMLDTSGEARDQQAEHAARLQAMKDQIGAGLARGGAFRLAQLADGGPSSPAAPDPDQTVAAARAAGARYLLLGVVQKMSTLVLWCRANIIDLETRDVVFDRWLTFRGDTDEAWRHAAAYLTREIEAHPPGT